MFGRATDGEGLADATMLVCIFLVRFGIPRVVWHENTMAEDIQLLQRYADTRAEDAFAALVERHISLVYSAALRQLDGARHRAEDVTQSVFVDLARQAAVLTRRDDIVGWLYTSTHYAAAKLKRSEARRQQREQEAHTMHEIGSESSARVEWERVRPVLDEAMHELNEADRQAVLLRFLKDASFAEVGRQLGLSEDAARMRVDRALDKLHALLAKRGIRSTMAALSVALTNEAVVAAPAGLVASITSAAVSGSTAAGLGTTAAWWHLMTASKITPVLAAASMAALVFVAYESSQAHPIQSELNRLRSTRDTLTARIATIEGALNTAERDKALREAALIRAQAESAAAASAAKAQQLAAEERKRQDQALQDFLKNDPELEKLRFDARVAAAKANHAWKPNSGQSSEASWQQVAENLDEQDLRQQAGIPNRTGLEGANFEAKMIAWGAFPGLTYYVNEPYTADQAARMQTILAQAHSQRGIGQGLGPPMWARFDWDRVFPAAAAVLSPGQLEALRAFEAGARDVRLRQAAMTSAQ